MFDSLSLFFLFIVVAVVIPIGIYSVGYLKEYSEKYSVKYIYFITLIFIASMIGVILSRDSITFMVFWELMSASSFFLVIVEYDKQKTIKAGIMYFVMTHISGFLLMLMFGFIFKYTGTFDFSQMQDSHLFLNEKQMTIIFMLALAGFGAKAGLVPLHAWLPKAHPAAPSNISAMMSGIMLKIGVYGFLRIFMLFPGKLPMEFYAIIMLTGAITALFSILNALVQDDIKKLLAYSSSENIGIIFGTIGLSMFFNYLKMSSTAGFVLTAALLHSLNHAVFKSLLFLTAGAVNSAASSKNMNDLGGLYRKMKFTAICAFVGTAAISAIPPLNGFASEFMILTSFIKNIDVVNVNYMVFVIVGCGIAFAAAGAGAMYVAVKSFGITFLGVHRGSKEIDPSKITGSMKLGMGILSIYAIGLGVAAPWVVEALYMVSGDILGFRESSTLYIGYDITVFTVILSICVGILYFFFRMRKKDNEVEVSDTWGCGFNRLKPNMQYSSGGYSQPVMKIFGWVMDYSKEIKKSNEGFHISQKAKDLIEFHIYNRVIELTCVIAKQVSKIQHGRIQTYIIYIFASLAVAIIIVSKYL